MIETVLLLALGFISASAIALIVAPSIWRRAVVLTERRVRATVPLSADELRAEKDRVRAQLATEIRRLEIQLAGERKKNAEHLVTIGKDAQNIARLEAAASEMQYKLSQLTADLARRDSEISDRAAAEQELNESLRLAGERIDMLVADLRRLEVELEDATFKAGNRQVDLVAREADIDRLSAELAAARSARKEAEQRSREAAADAREAREALAGVTKRANTLERKIERMISELTDRDEKIARREAERDKLKAQLDAVKTEAKEGAPSQDVAPRDQTDALSSRVKTLLAENRRLKATTSNPEGDATLREQMHVLAAEVVALAMKLEGENSKIRAALDRQLARSGGAEGAPLALADRVKALQTASL